MEALESIEKLINDKDFGKAKLLLDGILEKEPGNTEALKLHGLCCVNLDLFDEGRKDFETVVKFMPEDATSWFYLASCYDNLEDFIPAISAYERVIALRKDYIDAYKNLCIIHVKNGDEEKAIEIGEKAMGVVPDDHMVPYILGTAAMSAQMFDRSIVYLERAAELNPENAQVYNNLGTCYMGMGELDKACRNFTRACELEPENSITYFNIASILQIQNKHKEACEYFQKAYNLEPQDGYLVAMALSEVKAHRYEEAIIHYKTLIAHNPEKLNYQYNLACCYEAIHQYNYAIGILAHLIMLNPKSITMSQKLAAIYLKINQPMHAKELYERILLHGNISYDIYYEFAHICVQVNDLERAEKILKKVVVLKPDFAQAHKDLGVIYLQKRLFDYAKDEFEAAVSLAPEDFETVFEYANYLHATAQFEKADEIYAKALTIDPENNKALTFSALNKIHTKDLDTALAQIEKAIERNNEDGFLYFVAGRLNFLKGGFEGAKQYLVRSYELAPGTDVSNLLALCYYELGDYMHANSIFVSLLKDSPVNVNLLINSAKCYEKLEDTTSALAALDKVIEIFPESEEAHEMVRRLS